jgi:polyisoprenoid-binding protein YceI
MTQSGSAASRAVTPSPGRYRIDPARTVIRVGVRAMFGLLAVDGTFRLRSGELHIAEDPGRSSVRAVIDAGSFTSGLALRDADVISASLLDASAYPEITFTGAEPQPDGSGWLLPGSVTAHGVTGAVEMRMTVSGIGAHLVRFHAVTRVDRTLFGVTGKPGVVGRTVDLTIDATCMRECGTAEFRRPARMGE